MPFENRYTLSVYLLLVWCLINFQVSNICKFGTKKPVETISYEEEDEEGGGLILLDLSLCISTECNCCQKFNRLMEPQFRRHIQHYLVQLDF